jgi:glycosyltransferase involved in cell wall biosynthesis
MILISVAIITFNEEANIARCLASVQGIADEIVVIDSLSTDKTKEICQQYGVKWIEQPFLGYTAQKNFALLHTTHDWVLSLDADEALSEALQQEILAQKQQTDNSEADAYEMPRLTNYIGQWIRHTDWYPDKKTRLFRKQKVQWTGERLHEIIELAKGSQLQMLQGNILHYSYYSIEQHLAQINNFTDFMAKETAKHNKKVPLYKLFVNPIWKFIYSYFIRLGFLDGYKGFLVCAISAFATFIKYVKIREWQEKHNNR